MEENHDRPAPSLDPQLRTHAAALLQAGCTVHMPLPYLYRRHVGYAYITHPDKPGVVIIQLSQFPSLGEPIEISVPVVPHRDYGSAVHVDCPDPIDDFVETVLETLELESVRTRFLPINRTTPVDVRIPSDAVSLTEADVALPASEEQR